MSNIQHAYLSSYRLPLEIEQMEDGSFMATSPALEGFLVLADTVEEVISLAPEHRKITHRSHAQPWDYADWVYSAG